MEFIGAGILPYATNTKGELVFLLGLENEGTDESRNNLWSDFGGSKDRGETPEQTAYREFIEESMNAIGDNEKIKKSLKHPTILYISDNKYYQYVIRIEYDNDKIDTFNRIMDKMSNCMKNKRYKKHTHRTILSCPVGLVEKVKFSWFKPSEILKNKHEIRPIFYSTFLGIINYLYSQ
jgi:hypothetical protein